MIRLLALDLARKCGWADNVNGYECGTETLNDERDAYDFFAGMLADLKPDAVLYEDVKRHPGTMAAHKYGGYLALLRLACQDAGGVEMIGVGVGTIKMHATGRGNAGKNDMIMAARRIGLEPVDDNAADAAMLLDYGVKTGIIEKDTEESCCNRCHERYAT